MRNVGRLALLGALWLARGSIGLAQSAAPTDPDELIRLGVEQRRVLHNDAALELFRRANTLRPTPRARAQMALAEQALGRWSDAVTDMSEALEHTTDPWIAQNHAGLEGALAVARTHVGQLQVSGNVDGAELLLNGHPMGTLPLRAPVAVDAGTVVIEVRANGYIPGRRVVTLEAGAMSAERMDLVQTLAVDPDHVLGGGATDARSRSSPSVFTPLRIGGIGAGAVGVAGVVVGSILYFVVDARYQTCLTSGCTMDQQPRTLDTVSIAVFWSGVGLTVVGAAVGLLAGPSRSAPEHPAHASVEGFVGPGGAGLRGSF